jgi:predicted nucleic acid-binding protein
MKYVLDCSVALKWALPEADSARAIRLRDEFAKGIHELIAPDIFTPEVANGLASAERQARIKSGESFIFLNDILRAAPILFPTPPLHVRAMSLAISTKRAVYDCIYLVWRRPKLATLLRRTTSSHAVFEHYSFRLFRSCLCLDPIVHCFCSWPPRGRTGIADSDHSMNSSTICLPPMGGTLPAPLRPSSRALRPDRPQTAPFFLNQFPSRGTIASNLRTISSGVTRSASAL